MWGQRTGEQHAGARLKVLGKVFWAGYGTGQQEWEGCGPRSCSQSSGAGLVEAVEQELKSRRWFSEWGTRD